MGDAKRPNYRDALRACVDILEGFVTMELRGGKMQAVRESDHRGRRPIHKNSDGSDEGRQTTNDFPSGCGRHGATAFFVKNEAERVRSEFASELGVLSVSDAADFDEGHGGLRPLRGSAEQCGECSFGIGGTHQMFSNKKGIEAGGAQLLQFVMRMKTGFADGDAVFGNALD